MPEHAWRWTGCWKPAGDFVGTLLDVVWSICLSTLTLIAPPTAGQGAGGMEYPTLVTLGTLDISGLGGNPFADVGSVLWRWSRARDCAPMVAFMEATNDAEEPWLDEGFRLFRMRLNSLAGVRNAIWLVGWFELSTWITGGRICPLFHHPLAGKPGFKPYRNGVAVYPKPAMALLTHQNILVKRQWIPDESVFLRWQFGTRTQDYQAWQYKRGRSAGLVFWRPGGIDRLVYGE